MTRISPIVAGILAVTTIASAQATPTQATLQYNPTELASPEGAKAVYERLRLSAKRACEVPSPIQKRQQFACQRDIENDLVAQVGSPILLAMHRNAQRQVRLTQAD